MALGSDYLGGHETDDPHSHTHRRSPLEAILDAAAQCEAAGFDEVLVIYNTKSGKSGSFDSGLTASESGFLCDLFKAWLLNSMVGVLQGSRAEFVAEAVGLDRPQENKSGT